MEKGDGIKKYKLVVTELSRGLQDSWGNSQWYGDNMYGASGTSLPGDHFVNDVNVYPLHCTPETKHTVSQNVHCNWETIQKGKQKDHKTLQVLNLVLSNSKRHGILAEGIQRRNIHKNITIKWDSNKDQDPNTNNP